jgi:hypothetical protein
MRYTALAISVGLFVACGGSSRNESSRGDSGKGGSGDAGEPSSGGTGASGAGNQPSGGSGGVGGSGAVGGTTGKGGGAGNEAGAPSEPIGGVGNAGSGGVEPNGGTAGAGAVPSITSCSDEFPYVGEWEGSVYDFYFEPLEDVRLVVVANEELGGYEATLTYGAGDPPPPVSSGDEPDPSLEFWQTLGGDILGTKSIEPWPGFGYSAVRGAGCDAVFRVSISVAEPWDEWCSLQKPVYTPEYGWGCTYRGGGSSSADRCDVQDGRGNVLAEYPLWKCQSCGSYGHGGVCECSEAGCRFNHEPTDVLDLRLETSGGVDTLSGPDPRCGDCTVRLQRVE